MIIYLLLICVLYILDKISKLLGGLIPNFPDVIIEVLDTIAVMIDGGISFISYFFSTPVVVALISLVIAWHGFSIVKDAIMKVIGHFIAN